ncbi:MAG: DUF4230 domain-containing protein [Bacteroidia bacterium]|nr:DUF4230 domain-containing protein [Bacteroidia bacterium]
MAKKPFFSQGGKSRSVPGDTPPPPPPGHDEEEVNEQTQTNLLQQIKNLLSIRPLPTAEGRNEDDDENLGSSIVLGVILLGVIIGGFFLLKPLFTAKKVDPAYAKVEAIKKIKELTLVKHRYETIIPITKGNKEKLQFLIVAPAEVRGYIDLSKLRYDIGTDSLIMITLPEPEISQTIISIQNTKEYTFQRSFWAQLKENFDSKSTYLEAYDKIRTSLDSARIDVHRRAIINGILEDTEDKAEEYLSNMVNNLGYRVEFAETGRTETVPDSLEKMYQQIFTISDPGKRKSLENQYFKLLRNVKSVTGR